MRCLVAPALSFCRMVMRLVSFIWEILQQNSPPSWPKDDRDFSRKKNGERKVGGWNGVYEFICGSIFSCLVFQCLMLIYNCISTTVDGQNPAPPRMMLIPLFIRF